MKIITISALCLFVICTGILSVNATEKEGQCDGDSCKKNTNTCDEDSDEPCFFDDIADDDEEDSATPVLLRTDDLYPKFDHLSRIEDVKVLSIDDLLRLFSKIYHSWLFAI